MSFIDISVGLGPDIPKWPRSPGFNLEWFKRLENGDGCNNSRLQSDVHNGTHVDAPLHFLEDGATVEQLSLEILIGPAIVAYLPEVGTITARDLEDLELAPDTKRLLLRTRNSELWAAGLTEFNEDYVALTADAAQWVVDQGIGLIGVDYLSVQRYEDGPAVHQILLGAEIVVVEGLNLDNVVPGEYELICLPIKIIGSEGAPARAVLRPLARRDI